MSVKRFFGPVLVTVFVLGLLLGGCRSAGVHGGVAAESGPYPKLLEQITPELATAGGQAWLLGQESAGLVLINGADGSRRVLGPVREGAGVSSARIVGRGNTIAILWHEAFRNAEGIAQQETRLAYSRDGGVTLTAPIAIEQSGIYISASDMFLSATGEDLVLVTIELHEAERVSTLRLRRWNADGSDFVSEVHRAEGEKAFAGARVALDGNSVHVVWVKPERIPSSDFDVAKVFVADSDDDGRTWRSGEVALIDDVAGGFQLLGAIDGQYLTWLTRDNRISGLVRKQGTAEWVRAEGLPEHGDGAVMGYKPRVGDDGTVHVVYTMRPDQEKRTALHYFNIRNGVASGSQRLSQSTPAYGNTADWPSLAVDQSGQQLVVAWLDLRYYRPVIYANFSTDGGLSWQERDYPVSGVPGTGMAMLPTVQYLEGSQFAIAWVRYSDTLRDQGGVNVMRKLDVSNMPDGAAAAPDPARLKGRVESYWNARSDGAHERTFPLYDPYYRDRTSLKDHVSARTKFKILIHGYEIGEMTELAFGRYEVKVRFEHEMPEFTLPDGKKAEVPRGWTETTQEWVWVDENWHAVYKDLFGKPVLVY